MARDGTKTGGRDWVKGQSGNPKGFPGVPPEVKEARKLTASSLELVLNKYMHMPIEDLLAIIKDPPPGLLTIDGIAASIAAKALQGGDTVRLDFLLNRTIGKLKERVEVDVARERLQAMSKQELIERMEADLMRLKQSQAEETLDVTHCLPPRDGS